MDSTQFESIAWPGCSPSRWPRRRRPTRSTTSRIIAHANGERHIRNARLVELEAQITDRRMRIGTVLFEWIPATANGEAHRLVAGVLGSAGG